MWGTISLIMEWLQQWFFGGYSAQSPTLLSLRCQSSRKDEWQKRAPADIDVAGYIKLEAIMCQLNFLRNPHNRQRLVKVKIFKLLALMWHKQSQMWIPCSLKFDARYNNIQNECNSKFCSKQPNNQLAPRALCTAAYNFICEFVRWLCPHVSVRVRPCSPCFVGWDVP